MIINKMVIFQLLVSLAQHLIKFQKKKSIAPFEKLTSPLVSDSVVLLVFEAQKK
jgi:hypothetical protein